MKESISFVKAKNECEIMFVSPYVVGLGSDILNCNSNISI